MTYYERELNNDISNIVEKYLNNYFPNEIHNIRNLLWAQIYTYLVNKLFNSKNFLDLHQDINSKKIKSLYIFDVNYIFEISKVLLKEKNINNINIQLKEKNSYKYKKKIFFFFTKISIFLMQYFKIKKIETNILCYSHSSFQKNIFPRYLRLTNINYKIFSLNKLLTFLRPSLKKQSNFDQSFLNENYLFINKIYFKYTILKVILNFLQTKTILFIEGDNYESSLIAKISKEKKIKTICFQWGTNIAEVLKSSFRNLEFDEYFTYGSYYSESFKNHNKITKFREVGFPLINYKNSKETNNKIAIILSQNHMFIKNNLYKKQLNLINKLIKNNYNLIIRTHPIGSNKNQIKSELNLSNFKNVEIHESRTTSINDTLQCVDLIVSVRSSVIVEAASIGVIPIILNDDEIIFEESIEKLRNIFKDNLIQSSEDIVLKIVKDILSDEVYKKEIQGKITKLFNKNIIYCGNTSLEKINENINNLSLNEY